MEIFNIALLLVCVSVMETEVVAYVISIKADVEVDSHGNSEAATLHLVLDYVLGNQHKSCSNETSPPPHSPTPTHHLTPCSSDQKQLETATSLCPVVNLTVHTSCNHTYRLPATTPTPTSTPCKKDFIRLGDQCYYFRSAYIPWDDALKECKGLGATLAHPQNYIENSFIIDHIHSNRTGINFWLGGRVDAKGGGWVWAHDQSPIVYNDWKSGKPYGSDHRYCMHIADNSEWKWSDGGCTSTSGVICQQ